MADFIEVADRVWVARYPWADANVTAIAGNRGVVVVDTHASTDAGRAVLDDLRRLTSAPLFAVVNTHWHWDHTFGNAAFRAEAPDLPIHAHERAAAALAAEGADARARLVTDDPGHAEELARTDIVLPDTLFNLSAQIDLGDRVVELIHPGRGHTDGDIVVHVPDADVLLAGDLVEESAHPWIGDDSWPMEWAATRDDLLARFADSGVVPGHGVPVDSAFVARQRDELAQIARQVRSLFEAGVPLSDAAEVGEWPWDPAEPGITQALSRGYEQCR
ncbi:MBL fold metallo-hydrolase [Yimella sp. cx-573]|nr:MBL fold metallo-hydrolase [Yimella sp. cx-573]